MCPHITLRLTIWALHAAVKLFPVVEELARICVLR